MGIMDHLDCRILFGAAYYLLNLTWHKIIIIMILLNCSPKYPPHLLRAPQQLHQPTSRQAYQPARQPASGYKVQQGELVYDTVLETFYFFFVLGLFCQSSNCVVSVCTITGVVVGVTRLPTAIKDKTITKQYNKKNVNAVSNIMKTHVKTKYMARFSFSSAEL